MTLKNTADNYGTIAKWLHWLTALLFLGSYVSVYYRHWFTEAKTPENWTALQLHLSIGVTIGVIVLLRILWRIANRHPDPVPGSRRRAERPAAGVRNPPRRLPLPPRAGGFPGPPRGPPPFPLPRRPRP